MSADGVIFDFDGTLLDSAEAWNGVAERYLEELSVPCEEALSLKISRLSFAEGADYIRRTYLPDRTISQVERGIIAIVERGYRESLPLRDGAEELLKLLRAANIPMCVATSNTGGLVKSALRRLNIDGYFVAVITSDEVAVGKESPEIYLEAARRMDGKVSNTWVVEDSPHAIATAKRAGFKVAAVCDAKTDKIFQSADFIIDSAKRFAALSEEIIK